MLCPYCMRLSVHLPDDLARLLKQAALNEDKSMSALTGRSGSARAAALGPLPQMNGSHGLALPLVDAIVLATALEAGAEELWPTDAHLTAYEGRMRVVRL